MAQSRTGLEDLERALAASIARTETCVMDLNAARARSGLQPLAYRDADAGRFANERTNHMARLPDFHGIGAATADPVAEREAAAETILAASLVTSGRCATMAEAREIRAAQKRGNAKREEAVELMILGGMVNRGEASDFSHARRIRNQGK